jgi:methionine synthase II (cobalamin-independent)
MPSNVLLIGSIPLGSASAVFEAVGATLGGLVRRIPDGENGKRANWVNWQAAAFARIPFVEVISAGNPGADTEVPVDLNKGFPQFRVRPGFPTTAARFGPLGYADSARESYQALKEMKAAGAIDQGCRLQVGIATPLSVIGQYVDEAFQAAMEPAYEERLLEEVDEMAQAIPADELAIQWNLATELSIMAGHRAIHFDKVADGILERLVRLCERVPDGVELGLHFCYHDFVHNDFPLPADADGLVDLANGTLGSIGRAVDWIHLAVPSADADDDYFTPLRRLLLRPETEIYLGLVHAADGLAGTQLRMASARRALPEFGVASECGLGNLTAEHVGDVLRLHRQAAEDD